MRKWSEMTLDSRDAFDQVSDSPAFPATLLKSFMLVASIGQPETVRCYFSLMPLHNGDVKDYAKSRKGVKKGSLQQLYFILV